MQSVCGLLTDVCVVSCNCMYVQCGLKWLPLLVMFVLVGTLCSRGKAMELGVKEISKLDCSHEMHLIQ